MDLERTASGVRPPASESAARPSAWRRGSFRLPLALTIAQPFAHALIRRLDRSDPELALWLGMPLLALLVLAAFVTTLYAWRTVEREPAGARKVVRLVLLLLLFLINGFEILVGFTIGMMLVNGPSIA